MIELITGGLTYHIIDYGAAQYNAHKVNSSGTLISNPLYGLRYIKLDDGHYYTIGGFAGENSPGLPITGSIISGGIQDDNKRYGMALGAYLQNTDDFIASGEKAFRAGTVGVYDVVPLVGLEYKWSFFNVLITPIIANISVSWRFW